MWRVVKDAMADVKVRSLSSAKSFAVMGGVYATVECFLENYRGKKGAWPAVSASRVPITGG